MKTKTSLLIVYLASIGAAAGSAYAQETVTPDAFPEEYEPEVEKIPPIVPDAIISEPVYSNIELGVGYVADDAYFFGRYNGLQTEGAYVVGDIDAREYSEDGRYWSLRGTNLGLESRYLRLEGGKQGRHKFFLEWDELPNYMNNTVVTPFLGVGTDNLTLPSGFTLSEPLTPQYPFELETKRERVKAGAGFVAKQRWLFDIDFSHENKQGIDSIGGATATAVTTQINRTVTTSLLPEPIDYDTNQVNAILTYAGDQLQVDLKYHASFFDNKYDSLTWQNPFPTSTLAGSLALAPDNEFHQVSLTGAYTLPYRSRITAVGSMGRMTQNQQFQDYTINSGIATTPLPTNSLNGEVWMLNGQLKLASQPITKLRLNADLIYDERDNQTPVNTYGYVMLDGLARSGTQNNPYSYKKGRFNLDANYRFNAISSLRGGYKYTAMQRSNFQAGRENTDENTLFAKFKIKPHAIVDFELYGEASSRDGSDFEQQGYQDPLMRKYNLADRDRTKAGAQVNVMATDKLYFGLRGDYSEDDYTDTRIGLTEASQPSATFDVSWTPLADLTTYGYYTWEAIESSQKGNDVTSSLGPGTAVPTTGPWQADYDDEFNTVGIGGKWTGLGKWDLGADVAYTKAVGQIKMNHEDPAIIEDQFPDTLSEMISLKLYTDYHYSKKLSYRLGYWYEEYVADNWAVDELEPYQPAVVSNTLLLGERTMDYEVRVFTVSATYRFQ